LHWADSRICSFTVQRAGATTFCFEDGTDKVDLSESGLAFADLHITNEDFQMTIEAIVGVIVICLFASSCAGSTESIASGP